MTLEEFHLFVVATFPCFSGSKYNLNFCKKILSFGISLDNLHPHIWYLACKSTSGCLCIHMCACLSACVSVCLSVCLHVSMFRFIFVSTTLLGLIVPKGLDTNGTLGPMLGDHPLQLTDHTTGISLLLSTSVRVLLSSPIERRETRQTA